MSVFILHNLINYKWLTFLHRHCHGNNLKNKKKRKKTRTHTVVSYTYPVPIIKNKKYFISNNNIIF